jgi:hypothetical protein
MKIKRTAQARLLFTRRELNVLTSGYLLCYPAADEQWFRKQIDNTPQSLEAVEAWLTEVVKSGRHTGIEQASALRMIARLAAVVENKDQIFIELDEFLLPGGYVWMSDEDVKEHYPRCSQMNIRVAVREESNFDYIPFEQLHGALDEQEADTPGFSEDFHRYFGKQTIAAGGPYPSDVEATLERLFSGRVTGTQLFPD